MRICSFITPLLSLAIILLFLEGSVAGENKTACFFGPRQEKENKNGRGEQGDSQKLDKKKISEIIKRQKGNELSIYVGEKGLFINGKSVNSPELARVVEKTKLTQATVSAHESIKMQKVLEVIELLQSKNVEKFSLKALKDEEVDAMELRGKPSGDNPMKKPKIDEEKIGEILHRQKGETVQVYLNATGTYINGKSLNGVELDMVLKRMKPNEATISAESYISKEKIQKVEKRIRSAGIERVKKRFKKTESRDNNRR